MKILIDNGRMQIEKCGLGQVAMQFARALIRANPTDLSFQFLTLPHFSGFADVATEIGATHIKGQLSLLNKLRRIVDKKVFPYYYHGKEHSVRHAIHPQHLTIPARDKTPFILTSHDMHFMDNSEKSIARTLPRLKESVNRADIVVFISEFSRNIMAEHIDLSGKQTAIIYNGTGKPVNPIRPVWFKDEMCPFLFSVGGIVKSKNYHIMPPVMHYLPGYNLILAGFGNDNGISLLEDSINREKMQSRIFVPGKISDSEKAWLLQECKGFIFPSLKEGFGMPIIEALHFGKPVFCFDNTALPEVGGDVVFYWKNSEPKEMADLIIANISETTDNKIINERKKWAAGFSWDKNAAAYMDIYRKLVAKIC